MLKGFSTFANGLHVYVCATLLVGNSQETLDDM